MYVTFNRNEGHEADVLESLHRDISKQAHAEKGIEWVDDITRANTDVGSHILHIDFFYPDTLKIKVWGVRYGVGSRIFEWSNNQFMKVTEAGGNGEEDNPYYTVLVSDDEYHWKASKRN